MEIEQPADYSIIQDLLNDRERLTYELSDQIARRVKQHSYFTERKSSDFVQGRRSEVDVLHRQVASHDNGMMALESQISDMESNQKGFDKESYQQLKSEIKRRRDAKARLLEQGFPELRPYITV